MPRAIDLKQPEGLYDPTRSGTEFHLQSFQQIDQLIAQIIEGAIESFKLLIIPAIEEFTGLDLSAVVAVLDELDLDFTSPEAFLTSLIHGITLLPEILVALLTSLLEQLMAPGNSDMMTGLLTALIDLLISLPTMLLDLAGGLISSGAGLLGTSSPLNALNLFNIINPNNLGQLPFGHVGTAIPNLLANPGFDGAASVHGGTMWLWDGAVGHTAPGCVYTTANGTLKQLITNGVPVSKDQTLNLTIYTQWSGLTYTGTTPLKMQVVRLLNHEQVAVDDLVVPTSPPTNQSSWVQIGGDYTVPGGCDEICLQLAVGATATAGTVRFDDADVHKTGTTSSYIPFLNVLGVGGPANIGESIISTIDHLIAGFVGVPSSSTGASIVDMFDIGQLISSWSSLGRLGWDILGIRNNKPIDQGLMATSNSNFSLGRVAMQASAPTIAVTQSVSAIGFLRMAESNDKGVISWLGSGTTNVTACYVNIWQMNPTTGDMTLVHRSPDIISSLSSSMAWVIYDYSTAMVHTNAGELYGIEITIQGVGTHSVTGTTTWMPNHPTVYPKTYAATRNSGTGTPTIGTVITAASVTYATNIPWIEWGITAGTGTGPHAADTTNLVAVGASTLPIPTWCNFVDVIAVGGGGGGAGGGIYGILGGNGGGGGTWATATWARGSDFTGTVTISATVGAGGIGASYGVGNTNGTSSVVSITGHTVTAAGGTASGSGWQGGNEAGNQTYNSVIYTGGGFQNSAGGDGAVPGGGGASGQDISAGNGGGGARGSIWIVFRP